MNRSLRLNLIICLILSLATILVYWNLSDHQFINIDDSVYVTNNPQVRSGLNGENLKWAFTTLKAEFWHPLTWLSYMLDTQLFGVNPAGYLLTNLLLHVFNTILVFLIFKMMTGATWQSSFVAALFALHPLHVESVAWIAQRKDVLSTFFWMLTMGLYVFYTRRPDYKRYLAVCLCFVLGLMAKPMLVTLPFVLLLLDYWPLGRFQSTHPSNTTGASVLILIREKIPLFILAIVFGIMAFWAQKSGGGISSLASYPLAARIANTPVAYATYIGKMIWPQYLACFYPFPNNFPIWQVGAAVLLLAGITLAALKSAKHYPFFITGWLWYLGTLLPVIGLIKIGDFAMADRYTYIPLIGLFIAIAWGLPEFLAKHRLKKPVLIIAAATTLTALSLVTLSQVRYWTSSHTLFEHALKVTGNNFFAHFALGNALASQGKIDQATDHFSEAVQIRPDKATLHNVLGRALASHGKFREAMPQFAQALEIKADFAPAHYLLAIVLVTRKQYTEAIYHFSEALRLHPDNAAGHAKPKMTPAAAYDNLTLRYRKQDAFIQSIRQDHKILYDSPRNYDALQRLVIAYSAKGNYDKAFSLLKVDKSADGCITAINRGYQNWKPLP